MAVISIVGTSGVGKSFLVKQLASLECLPAFFEGEEGVIPQAILDNVFSGGDPRVRWSYFMERYRQTLEHARQVSESGVNCYVDGAVLNAKAILVSEKESDRPALLELINTIEHCRSDVVVILTADREKLLDFIEVRGRSSEKNNQAIERALKIQDELLRLGSKEDNVLVIDRSQLDFSQEKDLRDIQSQITEFLKSRS